MFLLPVRLHIETEAQITNSNHRVEIRARPLSCVFMQPLQGHSSITRPRSTHPGACLTYAGLSGPRQGRMLSFHACLKRGGGARSVVQLLPSFCHMFLWAPTQGGIQMYQLPGVPTFIPIILAGITWVALKGSVSKINGENCFFFTQTHNWELQIFHTESRSPRRHMSSHVLLMQSLPAACAIL